MPVEPFEELTGALEMLLDGKIVLGLTDDDPVGESGV